MKCFKNIILTFLLLVLVSSSSSYALETIEMNHEVINEVDTKSITNDEVIIKRYDNWSGSLSEDKKEKLKFFGFDVDKANKLESIKRSSDGSTYNKLSISDNQYVTFDNDNEIKSICNINENKIESVPNVNLTFDIISEKIKEYFSLGNDYELVSSKSFDDDYWNIILMRRLENGILNPYESIKATINKSNFNIVFLNRFNEKANKVDHTISKNQAKETTKILVKSLDDYKNEISLCYIDPSSLIYKENSYQKSSVELAYKIITGNMITYVDATTGKIIGKDQYKEIGGSYGQTNDGLNYSGDSVDRASTYMALMGYIPTYLNKLDTVELKNNITYLLGRDNAYAFYFCGHGDSSTVDPSLAIKDSNDDYHDVLLKSEVTGNWHFVFLDACHTGRSIWAEAFNISSSHPKTAYLGWDGKVQASNTNSFCIKFWMHRVLMNVRDAAVKAAGEVPGVGTTPIKFFGDTSYNGEPW